MIDNSSLEVARRIDAWWAIAKGDIPSDPFGPMARADLFQIGLPGADSSLDSYRAIAIAERAIAAKTGLLGLASAFAARQMTARFGLTGRFEFLAGDLLDVEFPERCDVATLGHILHSEGEGILIRSNR